MKNAIETTMSAEPFQIDVTSWQNGFYSVVVVDVNEKILFKSKTEIKN